MERKRGERGGEVGSDAKTILEVVGEGGSNSRTLKVGQTTTPDADYWKQRGREGDMAAVGSKRFSERTLAHCTGKAHESLTTLRNPTDLTSFMV